MIDPIRPGVRLPEIRLAYLKGDELATVTTNALFAGQRALVVGIPGAFTPVCHSRHLPQFIKAAGDLRRAGFTKLVCIAPNDPWTLEAWSAQIDPQRRFQYLSDGNQELCRAMNLTSTLPEFFMGARSARYVMVLQHGVIERISIEASAVDLSCTGLHAVLDI